MDDLISRQAAIDLYEQFQPYIAVKAVDFGKMLEQLPSAQPELSGKVERILDFLDTELHPIVSPDHWNVYSELHNMISMLPSAQPESSDAEIVSTGIKHGQTTGLLTITIAP